MFSIDSADSNDSLEVFTTRPDTLFGATYMVIAPEHPQLQKLTTAEHESAVRSYVEAAASKSDLERTELQKEKSGVFTGPAPTPIYTASKSSKLLFDYADLSAKNMLP